MELRIIIRGTEAWSKSARPWHYYHFVIDFLIPFFLQNTSGITAIYLQDNKKQTIDIFAQHFYDLFGIETKTVNSKLFHSLDIPLITLHAIRPFVGHLTPDRLNDLDTFLASKNLHDPTYPKILLIERGVQNIRRSTENGRKKRTLRNHNQIKAALAGVPFVNLVLEKFPFMEQIKYFYNAELVIAQHGAALANLIWMRKGSVLEVLQRPRSTFEKLAEVKGLHWHRIKVSARNRNQWTVDMDCLREQLAKIL